MTKTLVVVSGGTSEPSSTRMLADRIADRAVERAAERGVAVRVRVVDLRPLAAEIAAAQTSGFAAGALEEAVRTVAEADGLVVATPVYKAGVSGLVKSFVDVLDTDAVVATPTVLAATAGTARHSLVADEQLRSLFAYLRALTTPTSVFAAGEDWNDPGFGDRIDRAANELVVLLAAGVRDEMRSGAYSRPFTAATDAPIELDTDLMRLAAGGA